MVLIDALLLIAAILVVHAAWSMSPALGQTVLAAVLVAAWYLLNEEQGDAS